MAEQPKVDFEVYCIDTIGKDDSRLVSVICTTYNHSSYIADTIMSFVNQVTDFPYEIIVHDDASTDGTTAIVCELAKRYPEKIRAIIQTENQYSQGTYYEKEFIDSLINGKYVAICEGDDYWIDDHKLQKQFDIMEADSGLSACVHNTVVWNQKTGDKTVKYSTTYDGVLSKELIFRSGSSAFHTSSLFFRREYYLMPDCFVLKRIGDYPRAILLALSGDIFYLKEAMSVYRIFTPGSWSSRCTDKSVLEDDLQIKQMLHDADQYSDHKYHDVFEPAIHRIEYSILVLRQDWKTVYRDYRDILSEKSLKKRIGVFILAFVPGAGMIYSAFNPKVE